MYDFDGDYEPYESDMDNDFDGDFDLTPEHREFLNEAHSSDEDEWEDEEYDEDEDE